MREIITKVKAAVKDSSSDEAKTSEAAWSEETKEAVSKSSAK